MRYGLSLLVCFALTAIANAQCANCPAAARTVRVTTQAARVVVTAPARALKDRPIRQAIRNVFRR